MSSQNLFEILQEPHIAFPYMFEPTGNNCCVDFLTSWNYLWTNKVQIHTDSDKKRPILITYGNRQSVPYHTLNTNTTKELSVTGHLGNDTSTQFTLHQLPIIDKGSNIPIIIMSYIRYGSKSSFILIKENNHNHIILNLIKKKYQSTPLICPFFPCLRKKPEMIISNDPPQSQNITR